jgi:cytochrome c-type biogenesis protein CcmH/NrfF
VSRLRRAVIGALLLVAAGLVVTTVVVGHRAPSDTERVARLAGELRCPTCESQTVADSDTPVAEGMRAEVTRQVAAGRSDDQILGWFKSRYGAGIVLAPGSHGVGPVLWAVPAVVLLAGGGLAAWRWRRRERTPPSVPADRAQAGPALSPALSPDLSRALSPAVSPDLSRALSPARLALVLGLVLASGLATTLAFTGQHHQSTASASPPSATPTAGPSATPEGGGSSTPADPVGAAFDLLQQGQPVAAESLVRDLTDRPGRTGTLALLVLGLAQRADGDPAARATLERFLREHPHHRAAAQVRRLLAADAGR